MRGDFLNNISEVLEVFKNSKDTCVGVHQKTGLSKTTCYNHKKILLKFGIVVEEDSLQEFLAERKDIHTNQRHFYELYFGKLKGKVPCKIARVNKELKGSSVLKEFIKSPTPTNFFKLARESKNILKNVISNCMSVPMSSRKIVRNIRGSLSRRDWREVRGWLSGQFLYCDII